MLHRENPEPTRRRHRPDRAPPPQLHLHDGLQVHRERRSIILIAWVGPRHPRNSSFLSSSASVASKNFSSSSTARGGRRRTSCRSPSKGERSGTAKIRSFLSFLLFLI